MVYLVDGNKLALSKEKRLKTKVAQLAKEGTIPQMVSIVINDDASGQLYTRLKAKAAERIGVNFVIKSLRKFDYNSILSIINKYNQDNKTHGIMIQRPGSKWRQEHQVDRKGFARDWTRLVNEIEPQKDVDGLGPNSPCQLAVVKAVITLMDEINKKLNVDWKKENIVIVGSKGLVGAKLSESFKRKKIPFTGVDKETKDLTQVTLKADWLIVATGVTGLIKPDMVKKGVKIIDVGWPKSDVDPKVQNKAAALTPVPGGIGPVTVISLLENLVLCVYSN